MRLWSIHPKYLDTKGLVALWREALLAKNVLEGNTIGYKNHPQLIRFKKSQRPLDSINQYLSEVYKESLSRNYNFNKDKINWDFKTNKLTVTQGQVKYEKNHLLKKLESRDPGRFQINSKIKTFEPHPLFEVIPGEIEDWEIISI